ncbi:peptide chain release factor N(5)-glutamine methyltransferase [Sporolactobacillus vineae]|uniref:peptide chain release factor N(5)-glutamine methyltransferase n=1 Tax=Sporolactobacillus vineae TaxID=444463 RepID=UPI00028A0D01|nr:peptide chain release factor N(5)-glutamine methyltransferase [Sporolactobacillus vineae]
MTLKRYEALKWAAALLKSHHRDENIGEILLEYRLNLSRTDLLADIREPLPAADEAWLKEHVARHAVYGTPVQYMTGQAPFYGRTFRVTPDVLIPRPETEELVYRCGKWAARFFPGRKRLSVCDIGTGSGAIAVTLALEHPDWHVTGADISPRALAVAEQNAATLGAAVTFRQGDLIDPVKNESFDLLVSNPPYITGDEMDALDNTVRDYEPHLALFGGADGLDFYRRIVTGARTLFGTGPFFVLALEIGAAQGAAVGSLIRRAYPDRIEALSVEKDLAGLDRNVMAVLRTK